LSLLEANAEPENEPMSIADIRSTLAVNSERLAELRGFL